MRGLCALIPKCRDIDVYTFFCYHPYMDVAKKVSMNLPVKLLKEATEASGAANKTEAVVLGLKELIKRKRIKAFLALRGSGAVKLTKKELLRMRSR